MKNDWFHFIRKHTVVGVIACLWFSPVVLAQDAPEGIRPLLVLEEPVETVIPRGVLLLDKSQNTEEFLAKLEGHPPDWKYLYGNNVDERYDRLFDESEKRDAKRAGNSLLKQPIAFLWDGFLTSV